MAPVGAILTGGRSRRMGHPKALVEVDGAPMARRVADAALGGGCAPVVLIGGDRVELAPLKIDVIDDLHPGDGPVGGILTALSSAPGAGDVLVLPCDVPYLDAATVRRLIGAADGAPTADVIVARTDRLEPGCALWRRSAKPQVANMFAEGERAIHRVLRRLQIVEVRVDPPVLLNINQLADLPEEQREQ